MSTNFPNPPGLKKCAECDHWSKEICIHCQHCGQKFLVKTSREAWIGLVAGAVLILVFCIWGMNQSMPPGISDYDPSDLNSDAYYTAPAAFVPAHLKAPRTATFARYRECTVEKSGDIYTVTGWGDAQNSFGAMIRQKFICTMRQDSARQTW